MADLTTKVEPGEKVPFVHLHVHTEYSLLDGAARLLHGSVSPLFDECLRLGMPGVAITDHGNMMASFTAYSTLKAFKKLIPKDREFNVIYGNEFYTVDDMSKQDSTRRYDYNHLVLLAKSQEGLNNLMKLTSLSYIEGYYGKPRIDLKTIRQHSEGLVCLSACLAGVIPQFLLHNEYEKAKDYALQLQEIFGKEDFYIELQDHGIQEERQILPLLAKLAKEIGAKVVATNDVHYIKKSDAQAHDVMLCIQTGARLSDERRMKFDSEEFYLKSYEEMQQIFSWIPEALTNTVEIMEKCKGLGFIENQIEKLYPTYVPPQGYTPESYLRKLTDDGLIRRYGENYSQEIRERADMELNVIHTKGFDSYYLVVWDFINWSRENDIPIGPGRGSGVGSIVAYAIGITNVEPLRFDLLFERFLNPQRNSPPDFDIDICTERRGEVIDYVVNKYGRDKVCQILTLGTLKAKNAIRDVARVYDVPLDLVNKVLKMLPTDPKLTIDLALGNAKNKDGDDIPGIPDFIEAYNTIPEIKEVVDMAKKLEEMPKNISMHAAGVVICDTEVINACPLLIQKKKDKVDVITQFQKTETEALGLLKMDFLGLITLTDIHHAIKYVKEQTGEVIDFDKIGVDDKSVYEMISQGDTDFVFQLDSGGMRGFMTKLHPNNIEDLILGISMYRPGPMDNIDAYLAARNDPSKVTLYHESLAPILNSTFGFFVYQEQVMNAARVMAGYTLGEADMLRRAMGKKKPEVMAKERGKFMQGTKERGIDEEAATKTFDAMEKFATYAFNKSHAAAYAHVAYQTAYLKRHHLVELVCAILNNRITKTDKLLKYISLAKKYGVEILPADINKSEALFKVENGKIRFGLIAIKNIGIQVADDIVKERKANGDYKSLTDFCERNCASGAANKTTIENFAKAGAMDCFNHTRATIIDNYPRVLSRANNDIKNKESGQLSFFDFMQEEQEEKLIERKEFDKLELLSMEKEVLNTYMSGHPLEEYEEELKEFTFNLGDIAAALSSGDDSEEEEESDDIEDSLEKEEIIREYDGKTIRIAGLLDDVIKKKTKSGSIMATAKFMDLYGTVEVVMFASTYEACKSFLKNDIVVDITGRLNFKEGQVSIGVSRISLLDKNENAVEKKEEIKSSKTVYILCPDDDKLEVLNNRLYHIVGARNTGNDIIKIQYKKKLYSYPNTVNVDDAIEMMIIDTFGRDKVKVVINN